MKRNHLRHLKREEKECTIAIEYYQEIRLQVQKQIYKIENTANGLNEQQERLFALHYVKGLTLEECGNEMGYSTSRIKQIKKELDSNLE